jgi:ubiquinone biosynthesis O-methyltransferase
VRTTDDSDRNGLEGLPDAYADWRASTLGRVTDALEQDLILDLIGPPAGRRILDVGCGDGVLAVELASRGATVTGIDASPEMIVAARRRASRKKQNIEFVVAEAGALPFGAESFDAVVAVAVLCFVERPSTSLRDMGRVLRPGGRLVIGELGKWNSWAATRRIKAWLGSPLWRRARFRTASDLYRLAQATGFVDASVTGAIYYPPHGTAARLLGPMDRKVARLTTLGAAFLALSATKPTSEIGVELETPPN